MFYVGQKVRVVNVTDDPERVCITYSMGLLLGHNVEITKVCVDKTIHAKDEYGHLWAWNFCNVAPLGVEVL